MTASTAPAPQCLVGKMATFRARAFVYWAGKPLAEGPHMLTDMASATTRVYIARVAAAAIATGFADGSFQPGRR